MKREVYGGGCGIYESTYEDIRKISRTLSKGDLIAALYVCEREDGYVKCGVTTDLNMRVYMLKRGGYTQLDNPRIAFLSLERKLVYYVTCTMDLRKMEQDFFTHLPPGVPGKPDKFGRSRSSEVFPISYEKAVQSLIEYRDNHKEKITPDVRNIYSQFTTIIEPDLPSESDFSTEGTNTNSNTKVASERKFRAPRRM